MVAALNNKKSQIKTELKVFREMANPIHNYRRKQPKKQKWFHSNYGNCLSTLLLPNRVNIVRPRNNEYNYAVNMHIAWLNPLFQR